MRTERLVQAVCRGSRNGARTRHRGDRAHGVCAAAKAEHEQPIALLEMTHEEDVGVPNIGFEAVPNCLAQDLRYGSAEFRQRARRLHRADTGMIVGHLPRG